MRRLLVLLITPWIAGCQQPNQVDRAEYERLQIRVARLEERVEGLVSQQSKQKDTAAPVQAAASSLQPEPKPKQRFQLLGVKDQVLRYSTRNSCENAKQTLLDEWAARDADDRNRGIIAFHPTLTCIPIE